MGKEARANALAKAKLRQKRVNAEPEDVEVTVKLPRAIHDELSAILEGRGTNLATFLTVTARAYLRTPSMFELHSALPYKKFSGSALEDVIRIEPSYVRWLLGNVRGFKMSEQAQKLLDEVDPE